jgi:hypothetical protein
MSKRKVGRPSLREGEESVHVGLRLPLSSFKILEAEVARRGGPPFTVGWVARQLIEQGLGIREPVPVAPSVAAPVASEPSVDDVGGEALANGSHVDEVVVKSPEPRKRIKPPAEPIPGPPVTESTEGDDDDDEAIATLLRDTPL